jgi:hypothetical protein
LFAFAGTGLADPNLVDVPKHRHFVETATGELVAVGPQVCENPNVQQAFNQFPYNIHHTNLPSLGPQNGAPALHNFTGADLTFRPCSFTG